MGKMTFYMTVLGIALLLFHFAGLIANTPLSFLLDILLNPSNLRTSSWFVALAGILTAFSIGGIVVGGFFNQRIEQGATLSFTALLLTVVVWDFIVFFNVIKDSAGAAIAALIVSPMFFMAIWSAIEWWRNKD